MKNVKTSLVIALAIFASKNLLAAGGGSGAGAGTSAGTSAATGTTGTTTGTAVGTASVGISAPTTGTTALGTPLTSTTGTVSTPGVGISTQTELGASSAQIGNQPTFEQSTIPTQTSPTGLTGNTQVPKTDFINAAQKGSTAEVSTSISQQSGTGLAMPTTTTFQPENMQPGVDVSKGLEKSTASSTTQTPTSGESVTATSTVTSGMAQ